MRIRTRLSDRLHPTTEKHGIHGAFRCAALFIGIASLMGCTSWRASTPSHPAANPYATSVVRVTLQDSRVVVIHDPRVVGDSLTGWSEPLKDRTRGEHQSVALADVGTIERRMFDPMKSAGAVAGVYAGAKVLFFVLAVTLLQFDAS